MSLSDVIAAMTDRRAALADDDPKCYFHDTYLRTTRAVAGALERDTFVDPAWVEHWDAIFAQLYLDAFDTWQATGTAPGPWQIAFGAADGPRRPPLRMVLLGMNAHINFDLPQAIVSVITQHEFDDPALMRRREQDHRRIDEILASRVAEEDGELKRVEQPGDRTLVDHLLTPLNRMGTRRFLKEARAKVWANARTLSAARVDGTLTQRVGELAELSRRRVHDLVEPRFVVIELTRRGFGVTLDG